LVPGLGLEAPVDARALEVLLECTSDRRLGDLVKATAADRGEPVETVQSLVGGYRSSTCRAGFHGSGY
jgi:hypothetical protein